MNIVSVKLQKKIRRGEGIITLFLLVMLANFIYPNIGIAGFSAGVDASYYKTTSTTAGKTVESTSSNQGYSLNLTHALTSTINISGDVRWSITEKNGQQREDMYPLFYLSYTPPSMYYFSFSFNRSEVFPPGGDRIATSNMNIVFSIPLEKWPSISFTYNRTTTQDFLDVHKTNSVSTDKALNLSYGFSFLGVSTNLNYSYTNPISEDKVSNTKTETQNHNVSVGLGRLFLDKKIQTSANFGYGETTRIDESLGAPTRFEEELAAAEGLFSVDTSPTVDTLSGTPALIDNNTSSPAVSNDLDTTISANIGLRFAVAQTVHKIHIYINTSATITSTYPNFGWQLYTSNDGTNWTQSGGILTTSYEAVTYTRFVFTFSEVSAKYFKIVNQYNGATGSNIFVTEIEAFSYKNVTPTLTLTTKTKRDFGGINISFTPNNRLNTSYSVNYNHDTNDSNDYESIGVNQSVNVNLIIIPQYLICATGYTTTNSRVTQKASATAATYTETESGTDNYTISLSSTPLDTLGLNLNYGYTEALTGGETYSTSDSLNGSIFMRLYKGINLNFGGSMSKSEDFKSASKSSSLNYSGNLELTPWRVLTLIISRSTSITSTETAGGEASPTTADSLSTAFTFSPTRKIYISGTYNIEPTSSQSYSVSWLFVRNLQAALNLGLSGETTSMGANISWSPTPRLTLHFGYAATRIDNITQDKSDSVSASMSLRL